MDIRFTNERKMYAHHNREYYEALFWSRVDKSGDCWIWQGTYRDNGYGKFSINQTEYSSHKLSYYFTYGDIQKGMVIMHLCNNPACCNPSHLKLGTYKENSQHAAQCHRTTWGDRNHWAKLTNEQAKEIKYSNLPNTNLAKMYGVSFQTIWRIKKGLTFKYL